MTVTVERGEDEAGGIQVHTEVGKDQLDLDSKAGSSGLDVHTEAVAREDKADNQIILSVKEEVQGHQVQLDTKLEEENEVTTTATVHAAEGGEETSSVDLELDPIKGADTRAGESDIHINI